MIHKVLNYHPTPIIKKKETLLRRVSARGSNDLVS